MQAWRVFKVVPRPVSLRDIADRTGMSEDEAKRCICRLKEAKCIVFAYGSARTGRYYQEVQGVEPPPDLRGRSERAQEALAAARRKRWPVSRPISQITAARPKA